MISIYLPVIFCRVKNTILQHTFMFQPGLCIYFRSKSAMSCRGMRTCMFFKVPRKWVHNVNFLTLVQNSFEIYTVYLPMIFGITFSSFCLIFIPQSLLLFFKNYLAYSVADKKGAVMGLATSILKNASERERERENHRVVIKKTRFVTKQSFVSCNLHYLFINVKYKLGNRSICLKITFIG